MRAGRIAPRDFPRAKPKENSKKQPCQHKKNPIHPDTFTWIYILSKIGYFGDISDFFLISMFEEALLSLSFWNMSIVS